MSRAAAGTRQVWAAPASLVAAALASCGGAGPAGAVDALAEDAEAGLTKTADAPVGVSADSAADDLGGSDTGRGVDTERPVEVEQSPEAGPGEWLPASTFDLYGRWAATDASTVRALQFEPLTNRYPDLVGQSPVYSLFKYPNGKAPVLIERGTFQMEPGPWLGLKPTWNVDGTPLEPVQWPILPAPTGQLALKTPAGVRVYQQVTALP